MFKLDDDAPIRVLIRKHLDFKGRVDRKRYLHYRLFSILPVCLIVWLQHLASQGGSDAALYLILATVLVIIFIPVDFSYMVRRYHDLGRSGWFCLVNVIHPAHLVSRPHRRDFSLLETTGTRIYSRK